MAETITQRSLPKRILLVAGGLIVFTVLFIIACRLAVMQMFQGIASSRATGLAAAWDVGSMWRGGSYSSLPAAESGKWISRNAELRMHTDAFERGRAGIDQIAAAHHGFLERLVTESHSGNGRSLSAELSVPAAEFDSTITDLKKLGRVEGIEEDGEDSAVKLESATRNLQTASAALVRLQKLQRERKGPLHDALEVEKEIAQADSAVRDAVRQRDGLFSTIEQAHIRLMLREDFRAPLETNFAGALLALRNSMVEGIGSIRSSLTMISGAVLEYGLPIGFWCLILFWPGRRAWHHLHARHATAK